ncbi:OPT oligopeptide transporter protein-domain-containing protein [Mycena olivaceomarginata]|nr:OPT oligopeptide transporter protein-domain-containing protein [Mycena olivaceomarginata]
MCLHSNSHKLVNVIVFPAIRFEPRPLFLRCLRFQMTKNGDSLCLYVLDTMHMALTPERSDGMSCLYERMYRWYGIIALITLGLDTQLPVWGFVIVAWGLGIVMIIPEGILEGTTNQRVFLNIITELIAGYAWPGKPFANIMIKMYGYNSIKHGLDFAQDLKLGQSARVLFAAQIYASILSCLTQVGVFRWMLGNIENLCSTKNTDRFTCNGTRVVYNASLIWGTIGPQRMFQSGQTYSQPCLVVIFYLLYKRYPNSWVRYVNSLYCGFNSAGNIPPANTTQYSLWFIVGFRYNYLLSAGLDTGVAFATIVIFFALSYQGIKLVWWGNM